MFLRRRLSLDGLAPVQFINRVKIDGATIDAKRPSACTTECWVICAFIIPPDKNIDCEMTREEFEASIQIMSEKLKRSFTISGRIRD
jgi:hypothetical protein